jgi:hypothetical protein
VDSQVDVVLHQSHSGVTRPALLVVVSDDVFVVGIGMFRQVSLDQVAGFFCCEPGEWQNKLSLLAQSKSDQLT